MPLAILAGWMFFLQPPPEYRGEALSLVQFLPAATVGAACNDMGAEAHTEVQACARPGYIVLPDPCAWPTREAYAELVCHEKGHVLRWRHDEAGNTLPPLPPPPPPTIPPMGPEP